MLIENRLLEKKSYFMSFAMQLTCEFNLWENEVTKIYFNSIISVLKNNFSYA